MSKRTDMAGARSVPAAPIAWLATLAMPVALLALIGLARPAAALAGAGAGPAAGLSSTTPTYSAEVEEALEDAGGEEEEDLAEEEEVEEETEDEDAFPPEECLLRSARSRVLAYPGPDRVKLTINYTAVAPVDVGVDYRLTGKRGSLGLGRAKRRFGRHGVLRLTAHLDEARMERVLSARSFTVDFDIAEAPSSCQRFYTRRLTIRRGGQNQMTWLQSDSPFGID